MSVAGAGVVWQSWHTIGTLLHGAENAAGKGCKMVKKTRGKAAPDRQLRGLQRRILVWIFRQQSTIETFSRIGEDVGIAGKGIPTGRTFNGYIKELRQKGIPWSAKRFYDAVPTELESKSLSRSLIALESRGLLIRHDITGGMGRKSRAKYVRLTKSGCDAATFLVKSGGKSERELKGQSTPAELFVRKRLHYLRGRLKTEIAHLRILEERKAWDEEFGGRGGTCWDSVVSKEAWAEIAEADLREAREEIEKTKAHIEVMEQFRNHPELDRLLQNPRMMVPGLPPLMYETILESESKEEVISPVMTKA